ncbi:fluoride efflux transporter FluC [Nocardioides bizhenqiangii]|uniref:Fluoride-specific ion channel FluC n=1 Tax=Nocardioides bizhenqiangii TaxID=3095076 RepID=A0ABZ0ZNT0_9ACTN|nr:MULTISPECIES: CrcB family protein [unclassified Nocardioides]MDZ5619961.1 CrcB family protein [Nocardioides sp. HM23]WQQ26036.1 CrcB family protein [Nocardioides sp. HM61]
MSDALWVALGASVGAPLRFWLGRRLDGALPWGTLAVNVAASLVLGLCVGWSVDGAALALVGAGFCGGMSTYSSFAVQTRDLGRGRGTTYAVLTLGLGLGAAALGYWLAG